jgi:hypothetical protein
MQGLHVFKLVQPASGFNAFHNIASLLFRQRIHQIDYVSKNSRIPSYGKRGIAVRIQYIDR